MEEMVIAFQAPQLPETRSLRAREGPAADFGLPLAVVPTSPEAAVAVLKKVEALASRFQARVDLIVTEVVPYPLPLNKPPIPLSFLRSRLRALAAESVLGPTVRLILCRDRAATLMAVLKPYSLIVIGRRKSRWVITEDRLARKLRRAGYNVICMAAG